MSLVAPDAEKGMSRHKFNLFIMNRISVLNDSKFERMTLSELQSTKGGFCISCKKRTRKVEIGLELELSANSDGSGSGTARFTIK